MQLEQLFFIIRNNNKYYRDFNYPTVFHIIPKHTSQYGIIYILIKELCWTISQKIHQYSSSEKTNEGKERTNSMSLPACFTSETPSSGRSIREPKRLPLHPLLWQQVLSWQKVKDIAMWKITVGNLLALHSLRRWHPKGQMLPRHAEVWNKNIGRAGLLLPIHIYRSFIIQVLSELSVRSRLHAQKFRA